MICRSLAALCAALLLLGCDLAVGPAKGTFNAIDITGVDYGRDLRLTDHTGKPRTLVDFKGKVVYLFFGFTHCPDVCPTTLADAAKVIKQLGKDGGEVQVLFVTVDPKRDTPEVLAKYVPAFDPTFLGLYGDEAATRATARSFRVFYEIRPGTTPDNYSVDHSAGSYVFDRDGRLRLFVNYGMAPDKLAADVKKLLG